MKYRTRITPNPDEESLDISALKAKIDNVKAAIRRSPREDRKPLTETP
jgi:hypothetical protein